MFKRKTALMAFLLIAVMLLGVGFANLTDTWTVTGTASADKEVFEAKFDELVYIDAVDAGEGETDFTATLGENGDTVSIVINKSFFANGRNEGRVTLSLYNGSAHDVNVATQISQPQYMDIECSDDNHGYIPSDGTISAYIVFSPHWSLTDGFENDTFTVTYTVTTAS